MTGSKEFALTTGLGSIFFKFLDFRTMHVIMNSFLLRVDQVMSDGDHLLWVCAVFMWFDSRRAGDDGGRPAEVSVEKKVSLSTTSGAFDCRYCRKKIH